MIKKITGVLLLFVLLFQICCIAQTPSAGWVVPDDAKSKVCPVLFSPETVKGGETVFNKNCKSCHGEPGKQNWAKIVPPPGDPASSEFQKQTDGEMFFKVTTGKAPMPTFGNILSPEERWQVISYIRSFNKNYVQPLPVVRAGQESKRLKISMYANYREKKLLILCMEITKDKKEKPASGIDIQLTVKRYFGALQAGDPKTTDKEGFAFFPFPSDVPGGRYGILDVSANVKDESGLLFSNTVEARLAIGKRFQLKSLTDARAMWSVRTKAPIWLILIFSLSLITVWSFIFYILLSLRKLNQTT
jgi:cytochrome c5